MLVLSRKLGERIVIEPGIEITVVEVRGNKVRLGINAPAEVAIRRHEMVGDAPRNTANDAFVTRGWKIPEDAGAFI